MATEWNPTRASIFVPLGRGLELDNLSPLLSDTSFVPHHLHISNVFGEMSTHVPERWDSEHIAPRARLDHDLLRLLPGLTGSLGSPQDFQQGSHTGGSCPIQSEVGQYCSWARGLWNQFRDWNPHSVTVNILTLSEPHFCCLLNGGTPRNYPKKDVWRIKEHKYIRKVLRTVSGAWYTLSTC